MKLEWKLPAVAAGACFVLSLLIGLVAGAGWMAPLRALVLAVLAAGLSLGLKLLIDRFLPELGEIGREGQDPALAQAVDIKIQDEEAAATEVASAPAARGETGSPLGAEPNADFAEELEELRTAPNLAEEAGPKGSAEFQAVRPPEVIDEVDVLPDLDGFQDSFATHEAVEGQSEAPKENPSSAYSGQSSTSGGDPATIAKAVRTLLSRDQKG